MNIVCFARIVNRYFNVQKFKRFTIITLAPHKSFGRMKRDVFTSMFFQSNNATGANMEHQSHPKQPTSVDETVECVYFKGRFIGSDEAYSPLGYFEIFSVKRRNQPPERVSHLYNFVPNNEDYLPPVGTPVRGTGNLYMAGLDIRTLKIKPNGKWVWIR